MNLKKLYLLLFAGAFVSCHDLDIPPRNVLGENVIFGSEEGINSQLALIYDNLPIEDFRYSFVQDKLFKKDQAPEQFANLTGEAMGRDTRGALHEHVSFWDDPYKTIYDINSFIGKVNTYSANHHPDNVKMWIAEARFNRAFVYFALAKRYGGVILLETPIDVTQGFDAAKLPRNSEEETWNFIRADLDYAIANLPDTSWKGRANKYVAAAMQSRAMLFAGSIAKYTPVSMQYTVDGVMLCGIPAARATEYFKAAYDASMVFEDAAGKANYELYRAEMGATRESVATNFGNIFQKETKENIFARYFATGIKTHNFDEHVQPQQTKTGGQSDEVNPTVDFVEMFDGLPKNPDGTLKVIDDSGYYMLFDSPLDFFANAEPRLAATLIFPMAMFKGQSIEIRAGIYTGSATPGISRITPVGHADDYRTLDIAKGDSRTLHLSSATSPVPGMTTRGRSGITEVWDFGNISGFYLRKYLNPTPGVATNGRIGTTTFIEMRLAEVYLNRAEAAMELVAAGEGGTYRSEAWKSIDALRERAGADRAYDTESTLTIDGVRRERRKELAFENKIYWDLKRWRIIHLEQNNLLLRGLFPFYSSEAGKYFLDVHFQQQWSQGVSAYRYNFDTKYYYQPIPGGEITKNPNCKQNNGF
jgi:hypothetical protein